jgi:8-oxo-dGTP diphosphatase
VVSRDGDGWVSCRCGSRHWGLNGAAGLVLCRDGHDGPEVLLQHRADWVHDGGTWAVPGGARDSHEDPVAAALREANEEVGVDAVHLVVAGTLTGTDHGDWRYDYVLAVASPAATVHAANAETAALAWAGLDEVTGLPLHAGLARDWSWLEEHVRGLVEGRRPRGRRSSTGS